jgi:inorganic pyrophosphatase
VGRPGQSGVSPVAERRFRRCASQKAPSAPTPSPGNYGFVPHTLSGDGDPCDVIVTDTRALLPGSIISRRLVGVLRMEDEAGANRRSTGAKLLVNPAMVQDG